MFIKVRVFGNDLVPNHLRAPNSVYFTKNRTDLASFKEFWYIQLNLDSSKSPGLKIPARAIRISKHPKVVFLMSLLKYKLSFTPVANPDIPTGLIPFPSLDCSAEEGHFIIVVDRAIPRVLYQVLC